MVGSHPWPGSAEHTLSVFTTAKLKSRKLNFLKKKKLGGIKLYQAQILDNRVLILRGGRGLVSVEPPCLQWFLTLSLRIGPLGVCAN